MTNEQAMKHRTPGPTPILQTVLTCVGCVYHVVLQPPYATVAHHRCANPDVARRMWMKGGDVYTGMDGVTPEWCPYLEKESE